MCAFILYLMLKRGTAAMAEKTFISSLQQDYYSSIMYLFIIIIHHQSYLTLRITSGWYSQIERPAYYVVLDHLTVKLK